MIGLLRLVPFPVWGAIGAGALAITIAVGVYFYTSGARMERIKFEKQVIVRDREVLDRNTKFDTTTTVQDSRFFRELRELEDEWLFTDTTPAPMAAPEPTAAIEPRPQPEIPEPLKSLLEPAPSQSP